jgi:hypothetical protein
VGLLSSEYQSLVQESTELVKIVATIIRNNALKKEALIAGSMVLIWGLGLGIWGLGFGIWDLM